MLTKVIGVANQKGGVGKTTTAVNLGSSLALMGRRVLLIDLDPQANASSGLGIIPNKLKKHIYHVMLGNLALDDIILNTKVKGFAVAPSSTDLFGVEVELTDHPLRERIIARSISRLTPTFDYIIIDCPPSLGILTINGLTAATKLLIPVQCEYYALEGLGSLLNTFSRIKKRLNPWLGIEGFLLTMFDPRTRLSHDIAKDLRLHFNSKVFNTIIPRNIKLSEAPSYGLPVCLYDVSSKGAQHYLLLAKEIMEKERL
ncbi:MAG: ParA family protein [Deltaproteobacteria bacterium]|nr:ParA family protein [Deltaproteobacteria bacterium]